MKSAVLAALAALFAGCGGAPRPYAVWSSASPMTGRVADCADLEAWISKSGKEGVGVTIALRGTSAEACRVDVQRAEIVAGGEVHRATRLPPSPVLRTGSVVHLYVPFPFDDNKAWNDGVRDGTLSIDAAGERHEWHIHQSEGTLFACEAAP